MRHGRAISRMGGLLVEERQMRGVPCLSLGQRENGRALRRRARVRLGILISRLFARAFRPADDG